MVRGGFHIVVDDHIEQLNPDLVIDENMVNAVGIPRLGGDIRPAGEGAEITDGK